MTSPYGWKILELDDKPLLNKQTNDQRAGIIRLHIFQSSLRWKTKTLNKYNIAVTAFIYYWQSITFKTYLQMKWINSYIWLLVWYLINNRWRKLKLCGNLRKPAKARKGSLYCWNCTQTYWLKLCGNFSVCFHPAETGLKITLRVSGDGSLTQYRWNYPIVYALLNLYSKCRLYVSI